MNIAPLTIKGAALIEMEPIGDERGFFARSFCSKEFAAAGLHLDVVQSNVSYNVQKGTLRGLHFQDAPKPDPKLVSCIQGGIFDVVVDIREGSETFCQWVGIELTADNGKALFVPPGCAHGFITLTDKARVFYQMGEVYVADLARGLRWDDPAFAIDWPLDPVVLSERDANFAGFKGA